jgi:hypothetical protein
MGWVLVRAFGIIVGIATLLRVATNEKWVTYDPLFQLWLDKLRDIVELGFLTDLLGPFLHWAIDYVRSFGIPVPDLQDEWRPAFVLSALVLTAAARNVRAGWFVVAAPCLALACAVVAGLTGSLAPVVFAVYFAAAATANAPTAAFAIAAFAIGAIIGAIGGIAIAIAAIGATFAIGGIAAAAAVAAALLVFGGIQENWRDGFRAVFADPRFNTGFDILAAMLGALFLASWFASPPIW